MALLSPTMSAHTQVDSVNQNKLSFSIRTVLIFVPDAVDCLTEVISKHKEDLISRFGQRCDFIRPEKVA